MKNKFKLIESDLDLTKPFYKYLHKKDLDFYLKKGSIKIEPLSYYRSDKDLLLAQRDPTEATIEANTGNLEGLSEFTTHLSNPLRGIYAENCVDLKLSNVSGVDCFDAYVFCISSELSRSCLESFNEQKLGYDACIEINGLDELIELIAKEFNFHSAIIKSCVYTNKTIGPYEVAPQKIEAVFQKPTSLNNINYYNQKEVRVVFKPIKECGSYCRIPPFVSEEYVKFFREIDLNLVF